MRDSERQDYLRVVHGHQRYMLMAHLFARMLEQRGVNVDSIMGSDKQEIGEMLLKINREVFGKKKEVPDGNPDRPDLHNDSGE